MRNHFPILIMAAVVLLGPLLAHGADMLRDPTRPFSVPTLVTSSNATFVVSAIFVSQERRVAIVNGRRVAEGDEVDGATVVKIQADGLRLNLGGLTIEAHLTPAGFQKSEIGASEK